MKIIEERNSMEFFYVFVFVPIFNMNKEEKKKFDFFLKRKMADRYEFLC